MATIRDVAKLAGVSRSTVSLVLNGSPLVKEDTRQMVLDIINEIEYVPNNSARSLSSKVLYSLGIIIMVEDTPYNPYEYNYETGLFSQDVMNGISRVLADTQYSLFVERFCATKSKPDLPKLIKSRRVDGAFIVGGLYEPDFIDNLYEKGIPFVVVGGHKESKVDSISPDPEQGAYLATKHLIETGHESICLVNAPAIYRSGNQRVIGVERAIKETKSNIKWIVTQCLHNTGEGGYLAIQKTWNAGKHVDGIIAANTPIAMGILRFLYEKQIRIPDDISLIAYEDSIFSGYASPPLSSINARKEYMGEVAAEMLIDRLNMPNKKITSIIANPYFVHRKSVMTRSPKG